jgi:hypothetical protein
LTCQSATTALTRSITVAEGVFAPGHLGELTQHIPFELVDAVLEETGAVQRRLRNLPSRVGVYFVLALGLFPDLGYGKVWSKLVAGLAGASVPAPSEKALRDLRRRLGTAPLKALFKVLTGPLAQPVTPGARYRRFRTVAFDGCLSLKAPDTERNRCWLGKLKYRLAWAGYPTVTLMALVETGTRGLLGAAFGPGSDGEITYATKLLPLLGPDMLLLADRAFDGNDFTAAVAATGAQFLVRIRSSRRPPVLAQLPDGSYLTRIAGRALRVIDADITLTTADGGRIADRYRLLTSLLDPHTDPAGQLVRLYHERWEIESAFLALRHTLLTGRVLRSCDPFGLEQELWALLTLYQVLRIAMVAAVESTPGIDPDRASFTTALETARDLLICARGVLAGKRIDLVGDIGRAVLANLLPSRRARTSIRKVKSPTSRYHTRPADNRPLTSQNITRIAITVHSADAAPPPLPHSPSAPPTPALPQPAARDGRLTRVLAILSTDPARVWRGRDLARELGLTKLNSFCVQLSRWAHEGLIHKVDQARYTAPHPTPPLLT